MSTPKTNKYNLPWILANAIENDPYNPGDCQSSTTRLISMPQIVALREKYTDDIEEDVAEGIWRTLGQAMHVIFERAGKNVVDAATGRIDNIVTEKRYFYDVNGWRISGQIDLLKGETLIDWKVTSVWTYIYGSRVKEWEAQANVNRWLAYKNGIDIDSLENYLILRDWIKSKAGGNYPPIQFVVVPLKLWPLEEAEKYILERVKLHQAAQKLSDAELSVRFPCSAEDRWWNEKQKRFIRCDDYCPVSGKCSQNLHTVVTK